MEFRITDLGTGLILFSQQYTDGNAAWGFYTGTGILGTGNTLRFSFAAISTADGSATAGNFLDAAFGTDIPEPSTLSMLAGAAFALGLYRRRRART